MSLAHHDTFPRSDVPVVTCRNTADLIAALPQLVGYTADNSIFVMMFAGDRSGGAFRIDLPRADDASAIADIPDAICHILTSVGGERGDTSAPAVVITCTQTFAKSDGPPWRRLAKRIERRLRRDGIGIRELCCRAADGWASYLDPDAPAAGRPSREIAESPIALKASLSGETLPDLSELGAIPEPDPQRVTAVAQALAVLAPPGLPCSERTAPPRPGSVEDRESSAPVFLDTAEITRALLLGGEAFSPRMTARLALAASHPDHWLHMALGVMTRPEFPDELTHDLGPDGFTGVPVDIDVDPKSGPLIGWSLRRILVCICPDFTDHARLPRVRSRLQIATSESPIEFRPALLAFGAWTWWLSGSQTVAHRQVRAGLEIDPTNELALMVERLIQVPASVRAMDMTEREVAACLPSPPRRFRRYDRQRPRRPQ